MRNTWQHDPHAAAFSKPHGLRMLKARSDGETCLAVGHGSSCTKSLAPSDCQLIKSAKL